VLADTTLKKFYGLHDVKAKYTILTFWDPDCGHCKKEIPKLYESYEKLKSFGAEVYAVATMPVEEVNKWTDFINQNKLNWINVADPYHRSNFRFEYDIQSTPQIYVLDQDKKILAKRIAAEQVEDFVHHLADPSFKPNTLYQEQKEEEEH
jgi:alkyl hydroperoxide reductase subunit AhpC